MAKKTAKKSSKSTTKNDNGKSSTPTEKNDKSPSKTTTPAPSTTNTDNLSSAEQKNTKMSEERKFLTSLLENALAGNATQIKSLTTSYATRHNISTGDVLTQFKDGNKRTALHFACQSLPSSSNDDDVSSDIISTLLSSSFIQPPSSLTTLLRLKDRDGLTPLMLACRHAPLATQHPSLHHHRISTLLDKGTNKLALARSHAGATSLHYAAAAGSCYDAIALLCRAAPVAVTTASLKGGTPLHWAAGSSDGDCVDAVRALVDVGKASVRSVDERGLMPVVMAMAAGRDEMARVLVELGEMGAGEEVLPGGVTACHMAADVGLKETLEALVTRGGVVEERNEGGETPLDLAVEGGHVECVRLLLPEGENGEDEAKELIAKRKLETKKEPQSSAAAVDKTAPKEEEDTPPNDEKENDIETKAKRLAHDIKSQTANTSQSESLQHKTEGNAHFSKKNYTAAIQSYATAISLHPSDATYYSNRSAAYHALDQNEDALTDAVICTELRPEWPKAWFRLATARLALERYEDAAMAAWEGLRLDQGSGELKMLLQKCVKKGRKETTGTKKDKKGGEEGVTDVVGEEER